MLNIDCLLKNTEYNEGIRKYIKYVGNEHAEEGKDASFESVYRRLVKDGVEVDIETAGVLYAGEFSDKNDETFSSREDVEDVAGREFDETTKNLLQGKNKTGEIKIGDLPPRKAIAKIIMDAFNNKVVVDERTKSQLKEIQDIYKSTLERMLGDQPEQKPGEPERNLEQLVEAGLNKMNKGYRDTETGFLNNLSTLHEAVKKELQAVTDKIEASGDKLKAEQWKKRMADFQDSVYAVALTSKEAKETVDKALMAKGFEKTNEDGAKSLDLAKLATTNNSVEQLRNHVIDALTDPNTGKFDKPTAEKVSNALQREFLEKQAKMVEVNDKRQNKNTESWKEKGRKPDIKIADMVSEQVKEWKNYIGFTDREGRPLTISKKTAGEALTHLMVEAGLSRQVGKKGELKLDIDKVSNAITDPADIKKIASDYFENQKNADGTLKYDKETSGKIADAIEGMYHEMFDKVREHVEGKRATIEKTWDKPSGSKDVVTADEIIHSKKFEFDQYQKITGDQMKGLLFAKGNANKILSEIIKNDYAKTVNGKQVIDYEKLSNDGHSANDIKRLAQKALEDKGYSPQQAKEITDALHEMHDDLFNKVKDYVKAREAGVDKTWLQNNAPKQQDTLVERVQNRIKQFAQYQQITGDYNRPLTFKKGDAKTIISETLKNNEAYNRETSSGKQIDWLKMAQKIPDEAALKQMVADHLQKEGMSAYDAKAASESLKDAYADLQSDIKDHAQSILDAKQSAIERESPERKTAIHRLTELSSLGIFEQQNEKLLYHVLGVDKANVEDIQALKDLADTVSELRNEVGDKEYLNSYAYQNADRLASHLINRNKDDKSRLLKVTRVIKDTYGLMNMTLIANPFNLVENNWSGQSAIMGSKGELMQQMGKDAAMFSNRKLWFAVWKDVAIGGVEYGGAGDKWAHMGGATDKLNSLNFKTNPVKATVTALLLPFRALLNGSDAANKAIMHHNGMLLMMHRALMEQGWDKEDATHFLYESQYGESFEKAKEQAGNLIDKYGDKLGISKSSYGRDRATIRWANDLVKANLNLSAESSLWHNEKPVTDDIIEGAINSGFRAAAISLGHEANNRLSKAIHAGKMNAMKEERDLIERGKYSQAAAKRLYNTVFYDGVWRMVSGGANWTVLRAEGLGLGLRTAFGGDIKSDVLAFDDDGKMDKKKIQQAMEDRIDASRKTTRALTGLATSALALGAIIGYGALRNKEDDEDKNESDMASGMQGIKDSYILNRMTMKAMPDIALVTYCMMTGKGEGHVSALDGALEYTANLMNSNPQFTIGGHISEAKRDISHGTEKGAALAWGQVGHIIGDILVPGVPIYKPYKQIYQIGAHYIAGAPMENKFTKAHTVAQGAVMGGAFQDFVNTLPHEVIKEYKLQDWIYSPSPKNKHHH